MSPINRTDSNPFGIQANPRQYFSSTYLTPQRFSSIGVQFQLCLESNKESFLEIGSGNIILPYLLKSAKKIVFSADLMVDNHPDLVAQLPDLPFNNNAVDICLCFQVLEHLPLSNFVNCLAELARVARCGVIISLPDLSNQNSILNRIQHIVYKRFNHPKAWKRKMIDLDPEHFWEIGHGINYQSVTDHIKMAKLKVDKHFNNKLFPYHHFYVLSKEKE